MTKKLVGYIRVSSKSQEDNTSLQDQRRRISAYCEAFGYELVAVFEEVGSGTKMETRPQFLAALDMVKAQADGIIALKLDRVARNARDVLALVEDTLQPDNKMLVLLDLNVDTSTPTGRMILTVMAAVAQLEADTIRERVQGGRKNKHEAGGYAYGAPAYGQQAVDSSLQANEEEQQVIDLMRRHRKSGKSYYAIAQYLNNQGIKSKMGKDWSTKTVQRVLGRLTDQNKCAKSS